MRGRKRRLAKAWTRRLIALGIAVVAGVLFTFFTVDIGHVFDLKRVAETEGSKFMGRPMHIGKLSAYISPGNFALDDVVIEGLTPDARPFLRAKRITLHVPWWTLVGNRLEFEVRMTGWTMVVEQWPDGHQSFPHLALPGGGGPSKITKTVDSVFADRGEFIFEDHGTPWSVDVRNLNVDLVHAPMLVASLGSQYVGRVRSSGGTVRIQDFLPMSADLGASFVVDKGLIRLHRIDLVTDGAVSHVTGVVDTSHWPEQTYQVDSRLDFARMREIFFAHESWRISGEGRFLGAFHLYRGGRELKGDFTSTVAGLNLDPAGGGGELRFPGLRGSLDWLPRSFVVSKATSDLLGGRTSFNYGIVGFGSPGGAEATFAAEYADVDMGAFARYAGVQLIDLAGSANGRASLAWKNGHFHDTYRADAATDVQPPEGRRLADRDLPEPGVIVLPDAAFNDHKPVGTLPIGAALTYRFDRAGIEFAPSWVAAPSTYVSFNGHVGPSGDELNLPVHVTSKDWQASDRLLAAILTERRAPTKAIDVGGRGTFDGVLTESFRDLHATGRFSGESIWAFGVRWSRAVGDVQIADDFVTVAHGVVGDSDAARILVDGRFAFGAHYVGDELTGKFKVEHWPLTDFKAAFPALSNWPVEGTGTADLNLHGPYHRPVGTGTLRIDQGSAWQEPFDTATADLAFEGTGVFMSSLELTKGQGHARGNALINWDNTYSFAATGDHVALESLHNFKVSAAPLSGQLDFRISGAGSFDLPTFTFEGHVADLFASDEGVGDVTGTLTVRGNDLTLSRLNVEGRVQASGRGQVSLMKPYDADLTFSATDASIDPFLKFAMKEPPQLFRAVVSGTVRIAGPLAEPTGLLVEPQITSAALQLFDYDLRNEGPIHLIYSDDVLSIDALKLQGTDTNLTVTGSVSHATRSLDLKASGDTNLAILQAFKGFGELQLGGGANLSAELVGDFDNPRFTGKATVHDGRIRFPSLSRSLDGIQGPITFENGDLNLSALTGKMGGGPIQFGGVLRFDGFHPVEYQLTAHGTNVQVRYPEGFETTANADLWMRGPVAQPTLGGDVTVTRVRYLRPLSTDVGLLALGAAGGSGGSSDALAVTPTADQTDLPIAYDIHVHARSMPFIETKDISVSGSADDLTVRGTANQPIVMGRIDLDRGDFFFNGNRIRLVSGSIDFENPLRTEPFFDVSALTQAHVGQETYNITGHVTGSGVDVTCGAAPECAGRVPKMSISLASAPYLSDYDMYTLLLGGTTDPGTIQQRLLSSPQQAQAQLVQTMATQVVTAPIASRVGDIVGTVIPIDTFQVVPLLGLDPSVGTGTSTSARVTLGKAVSDKMYLMYSRDVTTAMELVVLEYTQNDRVSWVLSRNEDHTFALDFRIRHIF
jgi:hypothetical protein